MRVLTLCALALSLAASFSALAQHLSHARQLQSQVGR